MAVLPAEAESTKGTAGVGEALVITVAAPPAATATVTAPEAAEVVDPALCLGP